LDTLRTCVAGNALIALYALWTRQAWVAFITFVACGTCNALRADRTLSARCACSPGIACIALLAGDTLDALRPLIALFALFAFRPDWPGWTCGPASRGVYVNVNVSVGHSRLLCAWAMVNLNAELVIDENDFAFGGGAWLIDHRLGEVGPRLQGCGLRRCQLDRDFVAEPGVRERRVSRRLTRIPPQLCPNVLDGL